MGEGTLLIPLRLFGRPFFHAEKDRMSQGDIGPVRQPLGDGYPPKGWPSLSN